MNTANLSVSLLELQPAQTLPCPGAVDAVLQISSASTDESRRCGVTLIPDWAFGPRRLVAWGDLANWADENTCAMLGHLGPETMHEIENLVSEAAEARKLGPWREVEGVERPAAYPPDMDGGGRIPGSVWREHVWNPDEPIPTLEAERVEALTASGGRLVYHDRGEKRPPHWSAGCIDLERNGCRITLFSASHESHHDSIAHVADQTCELVAEGWRIVPSTILAESPLVSHERDLRDSTARALADAIDGQGVEANAKPGGVVELTGLSS